LFQEIIPRDTFLPVGQSENFKISEHQNQPTRIRVFRGMRKLAQDNELLEEIVLPDVEPGLEITVIAQWHENDTQEITVRNISR
jgi:molecular chaperone DnaK (HSP70)